MLVQLMIGYFIPANDRCMPIVGVIPGELLYQGGDNGYFKHSIRTVDPISNDVTKSTRCVLNVYKGTPRTRNALQHKATRTQRNPKQCNSCCDLLFANKYALRICPFLSG